MVTMVFLCPQNPPTQVPDIGWTSKISIIYSGTTGNARLLFGATCIIIVNPQKKDAEHEKKWPLKFQH